jgi:threonine dehydrogenase-like Zn-dependent dehydrogenase
MNKKKIKAIKSFGIVNHVVEANAPDVDEQLQFISGGGYDVVFDCAGFESAIATGIKALKPEFKKKFTAVALPHGDIKVDYQKIVLREIILKGSKGHTFDEFKVVARSIGDKKINAKKYITTRIKFSELQAGFKGLKSRSGEDVKAIIEM